MIVMTWNVNGLRAVLKKDFKAWLSGCGADVVMLQETKVEPEQMAEEEREFPGYEVFWNWSKAKKGYSGTATLTKVAPLSHAYGLLDPRYQGEGRVVLLEFPAFYLFNIYFPNGQMSEDRLAYKLGFYEAFLAQAQELRAKKPIVVGGDFNTAHREIDLKNPKANEKTSGFLPVERAWLDTFTAAGYVDGFRLFEPGGGHYTWWTYRFDARAKNVGWRIDYFFVSSELVPKVKRVWHEPGVQGSDHCPVGIEIDDA